MKFERITRLLKNVALLGISSRIA